MLAFANKTLEKCESTNDLARQLGEAGCPSGTWVSCKVQTKGRGRHQREWVSDARNLHLSIVIRPQILWTWIPLLAAVGVCEALKGVKVGIKWPNDLMIENAKLGGILCEGVGSKKESFIVVGIGLNCGHSPALLDRKTTCLAVLGFDLTPDFLREKIIAAVIQSTAITDPHEAKRRYEQRGILKPGDPVTWLSDQQKFSGKMERIGDQGELWVMENGVSRALLTGEVHSE